MALLSVVSECCPVGCGVEVFLVQSRKDGHVYSYCSLCSVIWRHPLEARSDELNEVLDLAKHQPEGFSVPNDEEIAAAGFGEFVLRQTADEFCRRYFEEELSPGSCGR